MSASNINASKPILFEVIDKSNIATVARFVCSTEVFTYLIKSINNQLKYYRHQIAIIYMYRLSGNVKMTAVGLRIPLS